MKKINFVFLETSLLLFSTSPVQEVKKITQNSPKYSLTTAKDLGFNIKNLTYVKDKYESQVTATGDIYLYNTLELWSAIYSSYNETNDTKYYYVLVNARMYTNSDKLQNGYYRIVSKDLEIIIESDLYSNSQYNPDNFKLKDYSPKKDEGVIIEDIINYNVGVSSCSYNSGVSYSIMNYRDSTSLENASPVTGESKSHPRSVSIKYKFENTDNKNVNNNPPYRGDFIRSYVAIYEIKNYSKISSSSTISFSIDAKATSQKYSVTIFGCNGHESKTSNSYLSFENLSLIL